MPLDVEHPEQVRGTQLEHVLHAVVRGGLVDVLAQLLEHRALLHGAFEHQREAELRVGGRVDQQHRRSRVLDEVARCLREELVRQRDVLVVDVPDPGQVGDVRDAGSRRRRDHRGHGALEAETQVGQTRDVVVAHDSGAPARGPGVWSNISSTTSVHATLLAGKIRSNR